MAGEIARGLADVKVYPVTGDTDTIGTGIDVPGARALTFQAEQETENWEGDDTIIAIAGNPKSGSGSLAVGRANPTAMAVYLGGTVTTTGTGGTQVMIYEESAAAGVVYVAVIGQSKSFDASGSAYRVQLSKAIVKSPAETMQLTTFNEPTSDLEFIPNAAGKFITRSWFNTLVAVPTTLP